MKLIKCEQCGANDFYMENGFRICNYCGAKFLIETQDLAIKSTAIELNSDVQRLLNKCKADPKRAKKYANLILDIDPSNKEALKYL